MRGREGEGEEDREREREREIVGIGQNICVALGQLGQDEPASG